MDAPLSRGRFGALPTESWWVGIVVGVVVGQAVLYTSNNFSTAWSLYLTAALIAGSLLPIVSRLAGGAEKLFLVGVVLSLQFQLGFNPIYNAGAEYKMAGLVGVYVSLTTILAIGLVSVRIIRWLGGHPIGIRLYPPMLKAAGLMLLAGMFSMLNTPARRLSMYGLWELLTLLLIAIVAANWASTREGVRTIRATVLAALFTQSLIILAENATGHSFSMQAGVTESGSWETARFAGTLVVPSVSATFIVIGLLFTMGRIFSTEVSRQRGLLIGLIGLGLLVLLISLTRSAWIAFIIGGTGLGWYLLRHGTLTMRDVGRIAAIAVVMVMCAWPALSGRLAGDHTGDAEARWNLVLIALAMVKAHPLFGVGLNNASTVVHQYANLAGLGGVWVFIVHNQFMLVAAETGLIGLAGFLWLFGIGLVGSWRAMQSRDVLVRDTAAVVFWCLVSLVWALNLDHVCATMTYVFLWFLIGMAAGLTMLDRTTPAAAA